MAQTTRANLNFILTETGNTRSDRESIRYPNSVRGYTFRLDFNRAQDLHTSYKVTFICIFL